MNMGSSSNRFVGTMKVLTVTVTATATVTVMLMANEVVHAFTTPSLEARWISCEAATTTRKRPHGSRHYNQLDGWFLVKLDGTNNDNNNEEASMDVKVAISNSDAYDSIELVKDVNDYDLENFKGFSNHRNKPPSSDIDVQVEDDLPWIDFSHIQERNDEKSNLPQQLPMFTSTVIFATSLISTLYMYYVGIFGPSSSSLSLSPTTIDPPNNTF
jgi:hypothetical protein